VAPVVVGLAIALLPVPDGLAPDAWRYVAIFAAVITGIVTEPAPPAAIGLAGVAAAAAAGLVGATPAASVQWALGGFANTTVWLIFAGYVFTLGYAVTGLGRRVSLVAVRALGGRTIGLGYAVALSDLALAPFTASAAARSAGTIFPVIRHIPELYGSRPDDGTARRIGAYLLYTALCASFVTSSMFITALAPNTLAVGLIAKATGTTVSWPQWFIGFAPVGVVLLAALPAVIYWIFPPQIRAAPEVPAWASRELARLGAMSRRETTLLVLVLTALALWIGASHVVEPALTAIIVVLLMVASGVVRWEDVIGHAQAWNMLVWFGTLVTLAGGLADTGFVEWLARRLGPLAAGLGGEGAIAAVVGAFFFLHYFFASITAHTATLLPVFLGVALEIPGVAPITWALLLAYPLGLMGVLTNYGAGQNVIYYGSGYLTRRDFWALGFVLGVIFLATYLVIGVPWLLYLDGR
jgi:L-tartrate/succinate antiporter